MPLMEDDPPKPFPRGKFITRPSNPGSGSVDMPQLKRAVFIGIDKADGIELIVARSLPPASRTRMRMFTSSPSLWANTQPADPAPMMM
jgi:hypothetical protein